MAHDKLTRLFFLGCGIALLAMLLLKLQRHGWSATVVQDAFGLALLGFGAIGSFACLRLGPSNRAATALCVPSLAIGAVAADIYISQYIPITLHDRVVHEWRLSGNPYDRRSRSQFIADLRAEGVEAYPAVMPRLLLGSSYPGRRESVIGLEGREVLPLGGVSGAVTVLCNDFGQWLVYEADEHGFNNSRGAWSRTEIDIAAVGDSFTEGVCISSDRSFMGRIQSHFPSSLNLGKSGNGPLLELATLAEYLRELKPRIVVWFYYEGNDLLELEIEKESPLLEDYLAERGTRQNLAGIQPKLDSALRTYLRAAQVEFERNEYRLGTESRFRDNLSLTNVRFLVEGILKRSASGGSRDDGPAVDISRFAEILERARSLTESWGGTLVVVYLPGGDRYMRGIDRMPKQLRARDAVLRAIASIGIPVVDIVPLFDKDPDPLRFFVARSPLHYTVEGHDVVLGGVLEFLERKLPSVSR